MSSDPPQWPRHPTIAHWIAALLCILYGFAKLSGAQFTVLDSELTRPMGEVSGFWLTWYYFGYSPVYGTLVALFQVVVGSLLLIARFRLLAALLLLPLALNIVAVDIFYGVDLGGTGAAIVLTVCLLLIVVPHGRRLWRAVIPPAANTARSMYLVIPLILCAAWGASYWAANVNNRAPTAIDGVWQVQTGGDTAVQNDPEAPTLVFFERNRGHMVVFRPPSGADRTHHFEVDSSGQVQIWRTWLRRDSLMYEGALDADGRVVLHNAGASARAFELIRVEEAY